MKNQTITSVIFGNIVKVFINGRLRSKACDTKEAAKKFYRMILEVGENPTEEGINSILCYLNEKLRVGLECGLETDLESGEVYMAGFNTPLPEKLVEVAKDYHENGFPMQSLMNFWTLLMLNPDVRVRESLFKFIETHDFSLTNEGYMIVYKAVFYKQEDKAETRLAEFISNTFLHVKKDWDTSPKKYMVYTDLDSGEYRFTKKSTVKRWNLEKKNVQVIGNLDGLYKNLTLEAVADEESTYTDMYTKKMNIEVGAPVIMPRAECNADPAKECSYGLHVGATKYVERFADWYGNRDKKRAVLVCYVNPAHVVAVPNYDNSKMRVSQYFPFAVATYDGEAKKIDMVEQAYFPSDYTMYEKKELAKMVKEVKAGETPIETAKKAEEEVRPMSELQKIIEGRLIVLSE
jgi:hypothetical protein